MVRVETLEEKVFRIQRGLICSVGFSSYGPNINNVNRKKGYEGLVFSTVMGGIVLK